jgi:hypothetical protein
MHLAIEATKLLGERRGIGRYVRNLLRQFVQQQPTLRFTMYVAQIDDTVALMALLASRAAGAYDRRADRRVAGDRRRCGVVSVESHHDGGAPADGGEYARPGTDAAAG